MQFVYRGWRGPLSVVAGVALAAVVALALGAGASAKTHAHAKHAKHAAHASSATISSIPWGTTGGKSVRLWTLSNSNGMVVKITNYGAVVQSIWVPSSHAGVANVALGFRSLGDYVNDFQHQPWPAAGGSGDTFFGAAIGRYANRIADHSFTLNGKHYTLVGNNGPNNISTLHGGPNAWNTHVWSASTKQSAKSVSLALETTDPAGYNGFPGMVRVRVTYELTSTNALEIHWSATTTDPTVINVTNHTYFNLAGEASGPVYSQQLKIPADTFTPTDANLIPTGQFAAVTGTPFDFRTMHAIGDNILNAGMPFGSQLTTAHGYDHNWVLGGAGKMKLAAVAEDPASGRTVTTYTTEPGIQVYTGNFLVGDLVGSSGHIYRQTSAFTLETQHYPDSPHHIGQANWPTVVLNPGQTFHSTTIYSFSW
jgi:aldose 1-epimerase